MKNVINILSQLELPNDEETVLVRVTLPKSVMDALKEHTGFNRPSEALRAFLHENRGGLFGPLGASGEHSHYPHYWNEHIIRAYIEGLKEQPTKVEVWRYIADYLQEKFGIEIQAYSLRAMFKRRQEKLSEKEVMRRLDRKP